MGQFKNSALYEPLSVLYHSGAAIQYRVRDRVTNRYRGQMLNGDGYYLIKPVHPDVPSFEIRLNVLDSRRNHHRPRINGDYETSVLTALVDAAENDAIFWEIGCYRGYFSLSLAPLFKEIVAVDTTQHDLRALDEAANRNNYDNISTHRAKLGDGTNIDDLVDKYGAPDVALMDIEGWEHTVLQDADAFLAAQPLLVIEVHNNQQVSEVLEAAGYRIYKIKQRRVNNYHILAVPE